MIFRRKKPSTGLFCGKPIYWEKLFQIITEKEKIASNNDFLSVTKCGYLIFFTNFSEKLILVNFLKIVLSGIPGFLSVFQIHDDL